MLTSETGSFMTEQSTTQSFARYEQYKEDIVEDITNTIQELGCQPILFVGSGISKRYFGGPSWDDLLVQLAGDCSKIDKSLPYYKQTFDNPIDIGQEFAGKFQEWAWESGRNEFPEEMFQDGIEAHSYIKYKISEYFKRVQPESVHDIKPEYADEAASFSNIKPHAIITTNYDQLLERLFPEYVPIIGQKILKGQSVSIGEIFKIHGCITEHNSIVFTRDDYDHFMKKKKYLSAKMLTFFSEHPVVFIGYNAGDPNIQAILSDIDEALPERGGVIPNVYIVQWNPDIHEESWPQRERLISTGDDRNIRVKMIEATDFEWVFDAFAANPALARVDTRVMRALIARSYELVRTDIPKMRVEADFRMLTSAVEDNESFARLFGIANVNDYSQANAYHPLSLTEVGAALGYNTWHHAGTLIDKVTREKSVNIKKSDNRYHRKDRFNKSSFHKYSHDTVELLRKVRDNQPYDVDLGIPVVAEA